MEAKRKRGKPAQYVVDQDGKPIVGLSYDKGNGQYFNTHYRSEKIERENFGIDYHIAVIRFREWESKRKGGEFVPIPTDQIGKDGLTVNGHYLKQGDGKYVPEQIDPEKDPKLKPLVEMAKLYGFEIKEIVRKNDLVEFIEKKGHKVKAVSKIPESVIWQRSRELILRDKTKAQQMFGVRFASMDELLGAGYTLKELGKHYQDKPQFKIKLSVAQRNERRGVERSWQMFCDNVGKSIIGDLTKKDFRQFYDLVIAQYRKDDLSTSWVRQIFEHVKRVLCVALKDFDNTHYIEQARTWATSTLVSPKKVIKSPPKLITPTELKKLLSDSGVEERAMWLLSLNAAYYSVDIVAIPVANLNLRDKTVVFRRTKTGEHRSAVLWDITLAAIRKYQKTFPHEGETIFYNIRDDKPYRKNTVGEKFAACRTKAKLPLNFGHRNFRDSFETICKIKSVPQSSTDAVMGHRQKGVAGSYVDPETYPQIAKEACQTVYDYYYAPKTQKSSEGAQQSKNNPS